MIKQEQIEELKNYIKELKKENFKLAVDNGALKEEQEQLKSDVYNYEMNLQHITAELKQARKETAEKILFKFESAFAYYDNEDMFSKKAIFECLEEIVKSCGAEIKEYEK